ncbi:MAG: SCO1664 family protein [Acidimicrobiales bacterium]
MPADERSPTSRRVTGWRPDAGVTLDAAVDALAVGEVTVEGRLPWSSNLTFLVQVEADGCGDLFAVYKPGNGERTLWDFPDQLYRREVAAYALSEALGWGLVPPTVERIDPPFGPGSLQLFVDVDYAQHYFTLLDEGTCEPVLETVCAFDIVANNADRKSGHVLLGPEGRIWAIDHGLCFHRQHKLRTVIWDFAGCELPSQVRQDLASTRSSLPDVLEGLLAPDEIDALESRISALLRRGVFPEPVGDRPPYPWPLV